MKRKSQHIKSGRLRMAELERKRKNKKRPRRAAHPFYKTKAWKRKTEQVLDRSGGVCEYCWKYRANQAHHRTYRGWAGAEHTLDLMAVCNDCHRSFHPDKNARKEKWMNPHSDPIPGSPADRRDSAFTEKNEMPGHWRYFTTEDMVEAHMNFMAEQYIKKESLKRKRAAWEKETEKLFAINRAVTQIKALIENMGGKSECCSQGS